MRDGYRVRRYRPRIEGLFARIERWTNHATAKSTGVRSPRTTSPPSTARRELAASPIRRSDRERIFSWLICESYDDKGNAIVYEYAAENDAGRLTTGPGQSRATDDRRTANRYLKRI